MPVVKDLENINVMVLQEGIVDSDTPSHTKGYNLPLREMHYV